MQKYILAVVLAFSAISPSPAQSPASPTETEAPKPKVHTGLRFVLIDNIPHKTVYIPTSKSTFKKIELRVGLPGERIAYPESGTLMFLPKAPDPQIKEKITPLLTAPLPAARGAKLLGLVGSAGGKLYVVFVDETDLKYGTVLFKNMTTKDYLVDMPNAPLGEEKRFLLKGSSDYLFGKNMMPSEKTKTIPAKFYSRISVNPGEEPRWIVARSCMITSYARRSLICLLLPNASGTEMEMQQIMLLPETNQAGEGNTKQKDPVPSNPRRNP